MLKVPLLCCEFCELFGCKLGSIVRDHNVRYSIPSKQSLHSLCDTTSSGFVEVLDLNVVAEVIGYYE